MATTGVVWEPGPEVLAKGTADYAKRLHAAVVVLANYFATAMEGYAKANAPWTDRTGHARQSLVGRVLASATAVAIVLAGLASYQIWLEVAHQGRWGIILPTVLVYRPQIQAALQKLVA